MKFLEQDIENYISSVASEFITIPPSELKKTFETDRICWAFVMWTYKKLNIFIDKEESLKILVKNFERVENTPYQFPDIVLFKYYTKRLLQRHAGIMLNDHRFVHLGKDCNGLQFTHLGRSPWNELERIVIRSKDIEINNN